MKPKNKNFDYIIHLIRNLEKKLFIYYDEHAYFIFLKIIHFFLHIFQKKKNHISRLVILISIIRFVTFFNSDNR